MRGSEFVPKKGEKWRWQYIFRGWKFQREKKIGRDAPIYITWVSEANWLEDMAAFLSSWGVFRALGGSSGNLKKTVSAVLDFRGARDPRLASACV